MKKVNKLSILTYLFLIFIALIKFFSVFNFIKLNIYFLPIVLFIYFIFLLFMSKKEYIRKTENKDDVKSILTYLIISLILYFLLGIVFGFSSNIYSYSFKDIIINIFILVIPVLIYEYFRYYLIKHSSGKIILYILITILIVLVNFNFNELIIVSKKTFYIKLFSDTIPFIIKNIILTMIMINYGIFSCLAYQFVYTIFIVHCPYLPNVGYFLNFLILSGIPLIVYSRLKKEYGKKDVYKGKNYVEIFTFILSFILLLFCFGLFKFVPIAAASNSMIPKFKRGDLIIYHKINDKTIIKEKDIIVFNYYNNIYIHRVKRIINKNNKNYYQTKGDNNSMYDSNLIAADDVIGIYKFKIKFLGYPSLWIEELLK